MRKLGRKVSFVCVAALVASASIVTVVGASAPSPTLPISTIDTLCSIDGSGCRVGAVGPGGGIVYYDAGSPQWWGRFLEATTASTPARGPWSEQLVRATQGNPSDSKAIGMGSINSLAMEDLGPQSVYTRHKATFFKGVFFLGLSGWHQLGWGRTNWRQLLGRELEWRKFVRCELVSSQLEWG